MPSTPKILMLGWEFPPLFSGGLGVATYGIVKGIGKRAKIRLVVPKTVTSSELESVAIQGLNRIAAKEVNLERLSHSLTTLTDDVSWIPLSLSPYHYENQEINRSRSDQFELLQTNKGKLDDIHSIFDDNDSYGERIQQKIHLYSHLAAQLASDGDFDVIHAHDWVTYPAGVKIKAQSGKPLVLHVHALETDRSGNTNEIYQLEKSALQTADRIIAVSEYTKTQLARHYFIDPARVDVVHNGIDPASTFRTEHKFKDKLVAFLGRLTHQKGPQFLIETAEKVLRVYPRVKFVVAGCGDLFQHAIETSAYKKLGGKIIFTGFLSKEKVNELLSMADVYFMPSVSEPFGLSALEAVQFNVPGVISSQSGAAEVLKNTLQADFWDTDKYANYLHALLKYNALKAELTEGAQNELKELTWENSADKVLRIYNDVRNN